VSQKQFPKETVPRKQIHSLLQLDVVNPEEKANPQQQAEAFLAYHPQPQEVSSVACHKFLRVLEAISEPDNGVTTEIQATHDKGHNQKS
jgi:glycerate-2-kinase